MQTCGTRDSFFSLCAKTSWILGIPKIPTISSFTRLCFGASKTVLFRTFQESPRFFKFVQKRFGGFFFFFFFRIAFPPSLPKLLDSRDFSRGDGLSEFLHFGFPRSLGLLELFELLEQKTQKGGKAKQGRVCERERHGVVEEKGLVGDGDLREMRKSHFFGCDLFKKSVLWR